MKKIIFLFLTFFIVGIISAQNTRWATIAYSYSQGPVSPEYQYNYNIEINETGAGKLFYTKSSTLKEYDFSVGKKGLNKLNKALKKSKVFKISSNDMKSDQNLMGGPQKSMIITLWQAPDLDAKPPTIQIPSQVKSEYSSGLNNLYNTIESLVPSSIWEKAKN